MEKGGVKKDLVTYNILGDYFAKDAKYEKMGDLIREMQENGIKPDNVT